MRRAAIYIMSAVLMAVASLAAAQPAVQDTLSTQPQDTTQSVAPAEPDSLTLEMIALAQYLGIDWDVDSLRLADLDSCCLAFYDSIALDLPDTNDIRKLIRQQKKEYRDSVRIATPRILSTFAIPDSLYYRRTLKWTAERYFNEMEQQKVDTSYNYHFFDYPFFKKDVNATYLGTIGSATQLYNYFKRERDDDFDAFTPYLEGSTTPDNMAQYNTKNPYTEMAYWGTTFSLKAREEMELRFLTTQNITPAFNFSFLYEKFGSRGMLQNEETDNRTIAVGLNHLGKKYLMNAGLIHQKVERAENGGIRDAMWIRDTVVDPKEIAVNLASASNRYIRNTAFITQTYAIPMNFFRKDKDSLGVGEGTMAFIGHSGEATMYKKIYQDRISDSYGRAFYFNQFYLNSTMSSDSLAMARIENKAFIKLQPFAPDAILAKINAGIGYKILSYYSFDPAQYFQGPSNDFCHNVYLYAGASGSFRKYIAWDADAKYSFLGYNLGDFTLGGKVRLSLYPIDEGIHIIGRIRTSLTEPNILQQKIRMNHHSWDNSFGKVSESRIDGEISIPKWKLKGSVDYGLIANMLYYDSQSEIRQNAKPVSILATTLEKDLKLGILHFDNRGLFQLTSDDTVAPLPKYALNSRLYIQFTVVKDAMDMQLGMNGTLTSRYYIQAFSPDLGVFYNQRDEQVATTAYFDAFCNMQWKCVSLFVKYTNMFLEWPNSEYFSAHHYIRPAQGVKVGVFWPF